MEKNLSSSIHTWVPILSAGASVVGIVTGAYGLATSDAGKKYPILVKVGMGAAIVGLGFLLYKEVLRQTKPEGAK
jgi:hypothetical protein